MGFDHIRAGTVVRRAASIGNARPFAICAAQIDKLEGLERARHETTRLGYAVPVDGVAEPLRLRHLVRFAQQGTFTLPRARLYRMYQPTATAVETGDGPRHLEVR